MLDQGLSVHSAHLLSASRRLTVAYHAMNFITTRTRLPRRLSCSLLLLRRLRVVAVIKRFHFAVKCRRGPSWRQFLFFAPRHLREPSRRNMYIDKRMRSLRASLSSTYFALCRTLALAHDAQVTGFTPSSRYLRREGGGKKWFACFLTHGNRSILSQPRSPHLSPQIICSIHLSPRAKEEQNKTKHRKRKRQRIYSSSS